MQVVQLELNQLRVFLEAARQGNYTVAGRKLNLSQSAVSHAIRKLELGLERPLVDWRARRFSLTPEGHYLVEVCERIFRELDQAERQLQSSGQAPIRLVLGATVEFGTTVLIRRMRPLFDANPGLHIDFRFSNSLVQPLLSGEVDLAVDCRQHMHPALECTRLFREKYAVIASPEFLVRYAVTEVGDLGKVTILSIDRGATWWDNFYKALPPEGRTAPGAVMEVTHVRGIINAAVAGLGVGFVPKYTVVSELNRCDLVELFHGLKLLEDEFCVYEWRTRASRPENLLVKTFLQSLDASEFGDAIASYAE